MSKLLLIDGNAIIHRAYHAMPSKLTASNGKPINAVYGFVSMLFRVVEDLKPTHIAVCFDRHEPTFRKKMFKEYQSHRPDTDKELISQFPVLKEVLDAMNITRLEKAGYEADDLIGTISKNAKQDDIVIVTGDKDQMQLVDEKVKLYIPIGGLSNAKLFGPKEVKEKLGVTPAQVVDLKAFMGDQSDNYPGVYGVGPKTAETLLEKYGTYPNVYKHIKDLPENTAKKLKEGKEGGDMSYELAKIVRDVDIEIDYDNLDDWSLYSKKVEEEFTKIGFKTLKERAEKLQKSLETSKQKEKQNHLF